MRSARSQDELLSRANQAGTGLSFIAVALWIFAGPGSAQEPWTTEREPFIEVQVALADSFPDPEAGALIIRRSSARPHDVILLSRPSVDLLASAKFLLTTIHQTCGSIPVADMRVRVREGLGGDDWRDRQRARLGPIIAELLRADRRSIAGVGSARTAAMPVRRHYRFGFIGDPPRLCTG